MKNLGIILVIGGIAIAGIVLGGNYLANRKSDDQILHEAILDYQQAEQDKQEQVTKMRREILTAPEICQTVKSQIFNETCYLSEEENNTDSWQTDLTEDEIDCMVSAYHTTNAHSHKLIGEPYESPAPSQQQMFSFACDVSSNWMRADIGYGEIAPATQLLDAFFADRSEQNFSLPRIY